MKTNYEEMMKRVELIIEKAPKLRNTNKCANIKKELEIYKMFVTKAIIEKKKIIEKNPEIKVIEDKINILIRYKKLTLTAEDFKEGLGINKHIYRLINTENSDVFNNSLLTIVELLDSVNVNFTEEDFKMTSHVNKFMKAFYKYYKTDKFVKEMKNVYDGLNWENNEICQEIVLNLKKNLKKVENKVQNDMQKTALGYAKKYNISNINVDDEIRNLLNREQQLKELDQFSIKNKIETKQINLNNFIGEKKIIDLAITAFIKPCDYMQMNSDKRNNFEDKVSQLMFNIDEYLQFSKFSFLIDDVLEILKTNVNKKEISNYEKKCNKLVSRKNVLDLQIKKLKNEKEKLLSKNCKSLNTEEKRLEKIIKLNKDIKTYKIEIKNIIKERIELDNEYNKINFIMNTKMVISDKSTLFDVLKLYGSNHIQLLNSIEKHTNCNLKEKELLVMSLKKLIGSRKINLTKSILINEKALYETKISEQAKNINVTLDLNNLEKIQKNATLIHQFKNLKRSKINLADMKSYMN